MPRILITDDATSGDLVRHLTNRPVAEVVTLSELDGIYGVHCTGDGIDECPGDIEPGDTWSSFEDCVREAVRHVNNHERRRL